MAVPKGKSPVGTRSLPQRPGPTSSSDGGDDSDREPQRASSKADAFNKQTAAAGFSVPVGSYVGHLIGAERVLEDGTEKESIKFTYEVVEGEQQGKEVPAWYNLFDKDGAAQRGGEFFKRDVYLLGIKEEGADIPYDEIDDILTQIENERLLCNFISKQNGQFFNIYLQGLAEG